jgi:hypothetical protein
MGTGAFDSRVSNVTKVLLQAGRQALSANSWRHSGGENPLSYTLTLALLDAFTLGYNPTIQLLYESTIILIKKMDEEAYSQFLMATQQNILELENVEKPYYSAQLGNKLRSTSGELSNLLEIRINNVLNKFRTELMKIITASDTDIVKKSTIAKLSGTINGDVEGRIRRSGEKNR